MLWADSVDKAWGMLLEHEVDLIVLDVMLPEGEDAGFTFAQTLRDTGSSTPFYSCLPETPPKTVWQVWTWEAMII